MPYELWRVCGTCGGDGVALLMTPPYSPVVCWQCGGSGKLANGMVAHIEGLTGQSASGLTTEATVGEDAVWGTLLCMKDDGKFWKADASDEVVSKGMLAIALADVGADNIANLALPGSFICNDTWGWSSGALLYIGATPGVFTAVPPIGSGQVVRVIGWAVSSTIIYFQPSPDYITLV